MIPKNFLIKLKLVLVFLVSLIWGGMILKTVHWDPLIYFDTLIKWKQTESLIANQFKNDFLSIPDFAYINPCEFVSRDFLYSHEPNCIGAFPIFLSYLYGLLTFFMNPLYFPLIGVILQAILIASLSRKKFGNLWIPYLFCTPLMMHSIYFVDVSITQFAFYFLFFHYNRSKLGNIFSILLYIFLLLFIIFIRQEVLIFFFIFLLFEFLFSHRHSPKRNRLLLGFGISVCLFLLLNFYFYSNPLGTRVSSNSNSILDLSEKGKQIISIMIGNGAKVGFLTFSPWILILILKVFKEDYYFKNLFQWEFWKVSSNRSILVIFLSLLSISFLAPNDGSGDWGVRYLSFIFWFLPNSKIQIHFPRSKTFQSFLLFSFLIQYLYVFQISKNASKNYIQFQKDTISPSIQIYMSSYTLFYYNYGSEHFHNKILQITNPRSWLILKQIMTQSNECGRYVFPKEEIFSHYSKDEKNNLFYSFRLNHPIIMNDFKNEFQTKEIVIEGKPRFYRIIEFCPK
jgi:hypothetical protein